MMNWAAITFLLFRAQNNRALKAPLLIDMINHKKLPKSFPNTTCFQLILGVYNSE